MIYDAINYPVLQQVPARAQRVLDLGCGSGRLGEAIRARSGSQVLGVTYSEDEAVLARQTLDEVRVGDLNNYDVGALGRFDCIICSHVLEHLYAPEQVLRRLRACLNDQGILVVALPNILFWRQRLQLVRGHFRYTDGGLMDRTHFRFFDFRTARELVMAAGYEVIHHSAEGGFPMSRHLPRFGKRLDQAATRWFPGLFGWQFVLAATVIR